MIAVFVAALIPKLAAALNVVLDVSRLFSNDQTTG